MPRWMTCNGCGDYTQWRSVYERRFDVARNKKAGKLARIGWRCKNCGHIYIDPAT